MKKIQLLPVILLMVVLPFKVFSLNPQTFSVISHVPARNANNINPSANVTITFSESLDQSTLTNVNIRIFGSQSGLHPAGIAYDYATKTVTLYPNNVFRLGEIVEVVVTKDVKSQSGSSLFYPYTWNFFVKVNSASDVFTLSQSIPSPGNAIGSIFSDLDNDGDLDVIVTHHDAANADIYRNNGTGNYTKIKTLSGNGLSWATYPPVSGDFDNDGDMDIAVPSRFQSKVCIWRNNGNFSFFAWYQISVDAEPMQISLSDLNGDGYLDMVVNCNNAYTYDYDILINDKSGNFSVSQGVEVPKRQTWQCLGDFDGDGDVDFIGGAQNEMTLYFMKNDGSGSFNVSTFPLNSACAGTGDFDNDGDLDLIVSTPDIKYLQVLFNNGTGTFTAGPTFGPQREYYTKVINDFNNDGFMDFAVLCRFHSIDIYLNNGAGTFTLDISFSPDLGDAIYFDAGDIDSDGDLDLIIPNGTNNYVSVFKASQSSNSLSIVSHIPAKNANNINPSANVTITFSESLDQSTLTNGNIRIFGSQSGLHPAVITYLDATKTVTLNPNSDFRLGEAVEVVVTKGVKSIGGTSLIYPHSWKFFLVVNTESSVFAHSQYIESTYGVGVIGTIFSELDNDGDLDAIVIHHDGAYADIYSNDGIGGFSKVTTLSGNGLSYGTYPPVSGDFDNDGDMDIAIPSRFESKISIWKNNGGLSFSAWQQTSVHSEPMQISLSDLNGDGYLDMVVNCNSASSYYYDILMNDKSGNYSLSQSVLIPIRQMKQCIGDFDGDGDMDFVGGAQNNTFLYFMKNDGTGTFNFSSQALNSNNMECGDFDSDGDLDLIASTNDFRYLQVLFNNGTGIFTDGPTFGPQNNYTSKVVRDFNHDGFLDFAVSILSGSVYIYLNNGSGTFTPGTSVSSGLEDEVDRVIDAGDIDSDGDLDLILPNQYYSGNVSIFKGRDLIVSHSPSMNATNINPSDNVTVTFSKSMDISALNNDNIRIFGTQSGLHPAVITYVDATKTVTLNPNSDFRFGEGVEVVITRGVKSINGSSLLKPYTWNFFVKVNASTDEFFLTQSISSSGNALGSIFCDLDNDTDLDIIVTNHDAGNADIYSNNGVGIFTKVITLSGNGLSWGTYPPVSGDFDNDGDMDIAIPSRFQNKVCIWRNNGGLSFSAWQQISVHAEPMQISLSDLNEDGYLDMVVNCNSLNSFYYDVLLNDKAGDYSVSQGVGVPKRQNSQCLGDFDGDGDIDFIGGAQNEDLLYFMRNDGNGIFTVSSFPLQSAYAVSTDYNNDGYLDLIVSNSDYTSMHNLSQAGGASFEHFDYIEGQGEYLTKVLNDFDNDGRLDFIVLNTHVGITMYIIKGSDAIFNYGSPFHPQPEGMMYFDVGDIDNDGDLDMVVPCGHKNIVSIYKAEQYCQTVFTGTGNWSDATRWSNGIPTPTCDAIIDGFCTVNAASSCRQLIISENGKLTIASPGVTCNDLVLKDGASILGNDKLTLLNPNNSVVERYIHGNWEESQTTLTASTEIHFVSTPVSGAKFNTFEKDALYSWHERPGSMDNWPAHGFPPDTDPMQSWHHYLWPCDDSAPEVLDLTNGRGYEVAINKNWYQNSPDYPCPPLPDGYCECPQEPVFMRYFEGTLNSGNFPVGITYTTGSGNPAYAGWNLIGNPYPSAVDWSLVSKTKVYPNSAAIWNPGSGGYVNVIGSGGTIPSTQSLFVQASGTGAGVTFNEASRIHNNIPYYKNTIAELLTIHVSNNVNLFTDEAYVHFDPVSQEGLDELDGRKLDNLPDAPMIWSVLPGDERLCFNTIPASGAATIDLYFKGGIEANYTLTASGLNSFDPGNTFFLEDLNLSKDTIQNLKSNPVYSFYSKPSDDPARFLLHFSATGIQETTQEPVLIYSCEKNIYVSAPSGMKGSIYIYSLLGQLLAERVIQTGSVNKIRMENYEGYALVQVISSSGMTSKKVFIR